jgi:hypothetical protein
MQFWYSMIKCDSPSFHRQGVPVCKHINVWPNYVFYYCYNAFFMRNNKTMLQAHRRQDAGTPLLSLLQFFNPIIQYNFSACNVPLDAGLQKRANFSTLIVHLAGTRDLTRTICVSGSGVNRSAIHYDGPTTLR